MMPYLSQGQVTGQRRHRIMAPRLPNGPYEAPADGIGSAAVGCHVFGVTTTTTKSLVKKLGGGMVRWP